MKKEFYIFRHGETDFNKEHRWQGQKFDKELNENGIKQAYNLAENMKSLGIEVIYSSPLLRALKTAQIISEKLHVPLFIKDNLKEGCFGVVEGLTSQQIRKNYKLDCEKWYNDENNQWDVGFEGGETKNEIAQRGLGVLSEVLKENYSIIGISAHGAIIRYVLNKLGYIIGEIPNGIPFHLVYEGDKWTLC